MAESSDSPPQRVPSYERQNTDDLTDLPLKIPVSTLYDHFTCTVCMSRIAGACVTTCGHRFCFKCIEEWTDRKHKCPCCNGHLTVQSLIRDTGFDALIRTVLEERSKAEKEYFKELVDKSSKPSLDNAEDVLESPLHIVLKKHLNQSLLQHEAYHKKLIVDYQLGLSRLAQDKYAQAQIAMRQYPHDPNHPVRKVLLEEVEIKWEEKKAVMARELERVEKLLANAFDRHLSQTLPRSTATIPVSVRLSVPEKQFIATDVIILPDDNMGSVLTKLRSLMEEGGLKVQKFPSCEEFEVSIINPFAPLDESTSPSHASMRGLQDELPALKQEGGDMTLVDQVVHCDCRPILEFKINPGTELRFKGDIILEGDMPTMCFAVDFVPGQSSVDYFTCQQCNYNWVCRACAEICHKGHRGIVPFSVNHTPTWACCNCLRKRKCTISGK